MDEDISNLRQLLRELVTSEVTNTSSAPYEKSDDFDQVSYTVRQVLQMGKENVMMEQLNSFLNRKDSEIERTCAVHHQV